MQGVRSLNNRTDVINQLIQDTGTDVMCLTETWHEDSDAACIRRLRTRGWQVIERARPIPTGMPTDNLNYVNHGGVAIVARAGIKIAKLKSVIEPVTFEHLIVNLSTGGASCTLVVLYRPGSSQINQLFFSEMESLFEALSMMSTPCVITGDINVRLDRTDDPSCKQFNSLLSAFGFRQHVDQPTHDRGGILDVVITQDELQPTDVSVVDVGVSDHRLVRWKTFIPVINTPTFITREGRLWKSFDAVKFRADLLTSSLCCADFTRESSAISVEQQDIQVNQYTNVLTEILDRHAPVVTITTRSRPRTDPWFDEECRVAKRQARLLERRFKRWNSDQAKSVWIRALHDLHQLVDEKRATFWRRKVSDQPNARATWKVIDNILCRERVKSNAPSLTANVFADYFDKKIEDIRLSTEGAPLPKYTTCASDIDFRSFKQLDLSDTARLIRQAPLKQCALDPIPTWLLKECADLLAPCIMQVINSSLCTGYVPTLLKQAYITPLLKKPGLDENDVAN